MLKKIIVTLIAVLICAVAGVNVAGYKMWPDDVSQFANAQCRGDLSVKTPVEFSNRTDLHWRRITFSLPESAGPYRLTAAYPEEMSLLYKSASGDKMLVQISGETILKRLSVVADQSTKKILNSGYASFAVAKALCMENQFQWSLNPLVALGQPALIKIRNMILMPRDGARPVWTAVQSKGNKQMAWTVFAEPEKPNRLYSVAIWQGDIEAQLRVVFHPIYDDADEMTAGLLAMVKLEQNHEPAGGGQCVNESDASGLCQAALAAKVLDDRSDYRSARRLADIYKQNRDLTGAQALLDCYRSDRFLDRDAREFYQQVQNDFGLVLKSEIH